MVLEDPKYVSSIYYIIAQHTNNTVQDKPWLSELASSPDLIRCVYYLQAIHAGVGFGSGTETISESVAGCDQLQIDEHSPILIKHVYLLCGSIFLGVDILFVFCNVTSITRKCSPLSCDHTESLVNNINILQDINSG